MATTTSSLLCTLAALVSAAHAAVPSCLSTHDFNGASRGGRARDEQKLGAWKEHDYQAHLLCESAMLSNGAVVRTKTEMVRGKIGFGTGWQSANPLGVVLFDVLKVNNKNLDNGVITIDPEYKKSQLVCGKGTGGDYWQFNKGMAIINKVGGDSGAVLTAYAFKTDAAKTELLAGKKLFSIDTSMLGCKLEVVVELPVPATGDASFEVQMKIERDTKETEFNKGLTITETATELIIKTDQETADSMRNKSYTGSRTLMTMAKGLVCGNTAAAVNQSAITITGIKGFDNDASQNMFTYTIKRSAIANCGKLYWDPTMTPFGGYSVVASTSAASGTAFTGLLASLMAVAAFFASQ